MLAEAEAVGIITVQFPLGVLAAAVMVALITLNQQMALHLQAVVVGVGLMELLQQLERALTAALAS